MRSFDGLRQRRRERYVIYADICLIEAAELKKMNIVFKKIPRDITRL